MEDHSNMLKSNGGEEYDKNYKVTPFFILCFLSYIIFQRNSFGFFLWKYSLFSFAYTLLVFIEFDEYILLAVLLLSHR